MYNETLWLNQKCFLYCLKICFMQLTPGCYILTYKVVLQVASGGTNKCIREEYFIPMLTADFLRQLIYTTSTSIYSSKFEATSVIQKHLNILFKIKQGEFMPYRTPGLKQ